MLPAPDRLRALRMRRILARPHHRRSPLRRHLRLHTLDRSPARDARPATRRGGIDQASRRGVYRLIVQVERYGGSVISFAGDAITCWFDDARGSAAARATTCAFALQQAMRAFTSIALPNGMTTALALKVAVASGPARRFVVGDPAIYYLDALAGATVARTSTAEHLARRGDVSCPMKRPSRVSVQPYRFANGAPTMTATSALQWLNRG